MPIKHTKVNHSKIVTAGLIDAALTIGFFVVLFSYIPKISETINPNLCIFLFFILYRFFTIFIFDSTLGMKIFKIIFLNGDKENINLKEKALASVFILFQGVDYYRRYETMEQ